MVSQHTRKVNTQNQENSLYGEFKREIIRSILTGPVEEAYELLNRHYPGICYPGSSFTSYERIKRVMCLRENCMKGFTSRYNLTVPHTRGYSGVMNMIPAEFARNYMKDFRIIPGGIESAEGELLFRCKDGYRHTFFDARIPLAYAVAATYHTENFSAIQEEIVHSRYGKEAAYALKELRDHPEIRMDPVLWHPLNIPEMPEPPEVPESTGIVPAQPMQLAEKVKDMIHLKDTGEIIMTMDTFLCLVKALTGK